MQIARSGILVQKKGGNMEYINGYKTMLVCEETKIPQFKIVSPEDVIRLMVDEYDMDKLMTEEIWALFTDVKGYVVGIEQISKGGLSSAICEPRSIFVPAFHSNAFGVALVHNHPSGDPTPSREDRELTHKIVECSKILGFTMLDHIVIARNDNYSFMEHDCLHV